MRKPLMNMAVILNLFPGMLAMIAVYFTLKSFNLTNSYAGLIMVYSASSGLGYLIAKGFFDTVPRALCEAARIDGCSEARIFFQMVLPMSRPIVVYTVISSFLVPWGLKAGMIFGVALSMMEYAFRGAGEIYTGNCVAVICLFLWLILYGREINFPSVLVETGRKYAFLIYLLHPAVSDLLKKCSEGLGVSNCQIYFWLRPVLVYMLTVVTVSGISAVSEYARQNILQNNHV